MNPKPDIEERLAEQLELPPGARSARDDTELAALIELAEHVDMAWSKVEPAEGAYERIWAAVQAQAEAAQTRRMRLPKLPRIPWPVRVATATALATIAVLVVTLTGGGPNASDILTKAEAAIAVTNKIAHSIFDNTSITSALGQKNVTVDKVESWTLAGKRLHTRVVIMSKDGKFESETEVTPSKQATYDAANNTITITPNIGAKSQAPVSQRDPLQSLRDAFGRDKVRFIGETKVDGKPGYEMEADLSQRFGMGQSKLTYIVDSKTYLPLVTRIKFKGAAQGVSFSGSGVQRYKLFELLEPTKENLKKLKMSEHPGAKILK